MLFATAFGGRFHGKENAKDRLRDVLARSSGRTMLNLKSLVDPHFNEDDVTILLVKRDADSASQNRGA